MPVPLRGGFKRPRTRLCSGHGSLTLGKCVMRGYVPAVPRRPQSLLVLALAVACLTTARGETAEEALIRGDYAAAENATVSRALSDPVMMRVAIRSLLAQGKYSQAAALARQAIGRFRTDAPVQVTCYDALLAVGDGALAMHALMLAAQTQPDAFDPAKETPAEAAARGLALQKLGADPRLVLDRVLTPATRAKDAGREPFLALGGIALDKRDHLLASETFRRGLEQFPADPDLLFGLASSFQNPEPLQRYLDLTLEKNPRHVPALLLRAEKATDAADFDTARKAIDAALEINSANPRAWALKSLLASLEEKPEEAKTARAKALEPWPENPEVDHIIGAGLGRRYRFAEAIEQLEQALQLAPAYLPVQFELGNNLLRFGREDEGWRYIQSVQARDPYHVAAYNLVTLKDVIDRMRTLDGDGVRVRMDAGEAALFGPRVLKLCEQARRTFAKKYDVRLPFPVLVDMLPTQQDFAVRTFSLPGGEGFLGVCFGPLITTASPTGRIGRANWEGVLWHEMAHSITLTATRHRIPRWLSEGISVHEENAANRGWGMGMTAARRAAILENGVQPIRRLDDLFHENIDRAYFESSLAVDFLCERVGTEGLRRILKHLFETKGIDAAIEAEAGPLDELEPAFAAYARERAEAYGPRMDWRPLSDAEYAMFRAAPDAFSAFAPNRFFAGMARAHEFAKAGRWNDVKSLLEPLVALEPENRESDNPWLLLAQAYRELGDAASEEKALRTLLKLDAGSLPAARRLLEIASKRENRLEIASAAEAVLAIDPAQPDALLALARGEESRGRLNSAASIMEGLLATQPLAAMRIRMEYARMLHKHGDPRAKQQVLVALEENPRFEAALELLLEITGGRKE